MLLFLHSRYLETVYSTGMETWTCFWGMGWDLRSPGVRELGRPPGRGHQSRTPKAEACAIRESHPRQGEQQDLRLGGRKRSKGRWDPGTLPFPSHPSANVPLSSWSLTTTMFYLADIS